MLMSDIFYPYIDAHPGRSITSSSIPMAARLYDYGGVPLDLDELAGLR